MKRIGAVLCLSLIMIFCAAPMVFAADFGIDKSSPKDGQTGMSVDNMGVKVHFNEDVYSEKYRKNNKRACKLVDKKGKEIPSTVFFNPDDHRVIMVLADTKGKKTKIKGSTTYSLVIAPEFTSDAGHQLGEEARISFETLNPKTSMTVSMVMMGVMVVGMIFFGSREAKKNAKDPKARKKDDKVNPYKEARKTGKSVEEIVAREEKKKEKEEEKKAAESKKKKRHEEEHKVEISTNNKRVSAPKPISSVGSTYKTGRAAAAKKAKAEAMRKKAQGGPKKSQNPNKNKGKRKRK